MLKSITFKLVELAREEQESDELLVIRHEQHRQALVKIDEAEHHRDALRRSMKVT